MNVTNIKSRNIIVLVIFSFLLFSFTKSIRTQSQKKFRFVFLTKKDWRELEKVSYVGKNRVTVVNKSIVLNAINEVQYKTNTEPFSKKQVEKLNEILAEYE